MAGAGAGESGRGPPGPPPRSSRRRRHTPPRPARRRRGRTTPRGGIFPAFPGTSTVASTRGTSTGRHRPSSRSSASSQPPPPAPPRGRRGTGGVVAGAPTATIPATRSPSPSLCLRQLRAGGGRVGSGGSVGRTTRAEEIIHCWKRRRGWCTCTSRRYRAGPSSWRGGRCSDRGRDRRPGGGRGARHRPCRRWTSSTSIGGGGRRRRRRRRSGGEGE